MQKISVSPVSRLFFQASGGARQVRATKLTDFLVNVAVPQVVDRTAGTSHHDRASPEQSEIPRPTRHRQRGRIRRHRDSPSWPRSRRKEISGVRMEGGTECSAHRMASTRAKSRSVCPSSRGSSKGASTVDSWGASLPISGSGNSASQQSVPPLPLHWSIESVHVLSATR